MAVIERGRRSLKGQANRYLGISFFYLGLIFLYGIYVFEKVILLTMNPWLHLLPLFWLIGLCLYFKKYKKFLAGAKGEKSLLKQLKKLPNNYYVFTNFRIKKKHCIDEIDFIVVGENGVFVLEAKNHVGRISGNSEASHWRQEKKKYKGKIKVQAMTNPIKQTKKHMGNVAQMLTKQNFYLYICGIVVFTNPNAFITAQSKDVFMIKGCKRVNQFILSFCPRKKLETAEVAAIVQYLKSVKL